MGEEDVPWEQWFVHPSYEFPLLKRSYRIINAELRQPKSDRGNEENTIVHGISRSPIEMSDRQAFNSTLAATLTKSIHTMLTHTSSERGRAAVPLITDASGISPFPIKITVKVGGMEIG
jgi:autophagy-related protein 101